MNVNETEPEIDFDCFAHSSASDSTLSLIATQPCSPFEAFQFTTLSLELERVGLLERAALFYDPRKGVAGQIAVMRQLLMSAPVTQPATTNTPTPAATPPAMGWGKFAQTLLLDANTRPRTMGELHARLQEHGYRSSLSALYKLPGVGALAEACGVKAKRGAQSDRPKGFKNSHTRKFDAFENEDD